MTIFETTALQISGISETSKIGKIISKRSEIFKMSFGKVAENNNV